MGRSIIRRSFRAWLILGAVALMVVGFRSPPARADDEGPIAYSEVRLPQPVTTYTQPDPNSPVAFTLPAFSVVDAISRQVGTDGAIWLQVTSPDRAPLGWMRLSDFLTGAFLFDDVPLPFP